LSPPLETIRVNYNSAGLPWKIGHSRRNPPPCGGISKGC